MSNQPLRGPGPGSRAALSLDYPMSLAVFDDYAEAQRAVDYLSDHEFPVRDVLIVGTDLKQLERVTGRLTRTRAVGGGALSGAWLGFFVGIIFATFDTSGFAVASVVATIIMGAVFGAIWALIIYGLAGGSRRDFTSVSQVVATKYEVLVEHKHVQRGRELLAEMDPLRAAQEQVRRAQEEERAAAQRADEGYGNPGSTPPGI